MLSLVQPRHRLLVEFSLLALFEVFVSSAILVAFVLLLLSALFPFVASIFSIFLFLFLPQTLQNRHHNHPLRHPRHPHHLAPLTISFSMLWQQHLVSKSQDPRQTTIKTHGNCIDHLLLARNDAKYLQHRDRSNLTNGHARYFQKHFLQRDL